MKLALVVISAALAAGPVAGEAPARAPRPPEAAAAEPKKPAEKKQQASQPRPDAPKADGKTTASEVTPAPRTAATPGGAATHDAKGDAAEKPCEPVKPCAID